MALRLGPGLADEEVDLVELALDAVRLGGEAVRQLGEGRRRLDRLRCGVGARRIGGRPGIARLDYLNPPAS
ncbi:MAG TPA: hypothetical protein VJ506_10505 [Candidatus Limnocylindrales bacterium]|nr:hypothetical protein [Candidatus Limnocylindrales bacterium]